MAVEVVEQRKWIRFSRTWCPDLNMWIVTEKCDGSTRSKLEKK